MTGQIVLHIGMHETGAGAIQCALAGYDDGRTRMARLGPPNHSAPMVTVFCPDPSRYHVWVRQGLDGAQVEQRRACYEARLSAELTLGRERLVISGEEMSLLPPAAVVRMTGWLAARSGGLRVMGWLRPAADFTAAAFAQMVLAGLATPDLPRPRYRARFEPWLGLPPPATVECHRQDTGDGAAGLGAFCAALDIAPPPAAGAGPALSADALRLVWAFNRSGAPPATGLPGLTARRRLIRHLAARHPGPCDFPAAAAASAVDPRDSGWAEEMTGLCLTHGDTVDADTGQAALRDWLAALSDTAADRLDEDIDIIRCRLPAGATVGQKVAALHAALLDEVEVEQALRPVFRAPHRDSLSGTRDRTRTGMPEG